MTIPPDCEPGPGATRVRIPAEERTYWSRIIRRLPGGVELKHGKACELVLIPYEPNGQKLPSFYIMENKVWNELFGVFYEEHLEKHPSLRPKAIPSNSTEKVPDSTDNLVNRDWSEDWRIYGAAKGDGDMPAIDYPLNPGNGRQFCCSAGFCDMDGRKASLRQAMGYCSRLIFT